MSLYNDGFVTFADQQEGWGSTNFKYDLVNHFDKESDFVYFFNKHDQLLLKMEDWFKENNINYFIKPEYECVKYVFVPMIDNENEYELIGYCILFENKTDKVRFKLVWG